MRLLIKPASLIATRIWGRNHQSGAEASQLQTRYHDNGNSQPLANAIIKEFKKKDDW